MKNVSREINYESISIGGFYGKRKMKIKDHFLTGEDFEIYEDVRTGILFTSPQPNENLDKYYESKNYISHTDGKKTLFERLYQIVKYINLRRKLKLINSISEGKKILDYGCGVGDFLHLMKKNGYDVLGIEPNENARKIAQKKIGESIVTTSRLNSIKEKFDVITLWHVLEHVPNLTETIDQLKNHLTEKGVLVIAVPNHKSYDAGYYGSCWAAYDVPRHLWHFSADSMRKIVGDFGMKVVGIRPMKLDSFYVSLLSEKYKKNMFRYFNSIKIGLKSNYLASRNGEYSSLIYLIKS